MQVFDKAGQTFSNVNSQMPLLLTPFQLLFFFPSKTNLQQGHTLPRINLNMDFPRAKNINNFMPQGLAVRWSIALEGLT